ncbi:hypothetical protein vBKpnAMK6_00451 [Klebsiella phage vB_Kpn_AM_K6]
MKVSFCSVIRLQPLFQHRLTQQDDVAQPWMSPAGYRRGQILNCIKLAIEPRQAHRDRMYQAGINPVTGQGTGDGFILFGDKTATTVPTADFWNFAIYITHLTNFSLKVLITSRPWSAPFLQSAIVHASPFWYL